MNIFENRNALMPLSAKTKMAYLLILALLLWASGAPFFLANARAAALSSVSDTLSDSNLGVLAKHVISFTNATSTIANQTIVVHFDTAPSSPGTSAFVEAFSAATSSDITLSGMSQVTNLAACPGTGTSYFVTGNYNNGTDENLTITICSGTNSMTSGTKTLTIGAVTKLITNPNSVGSFPITINGTQDNSGETRVAIINNVTVTASVATTFTFTVSGLATSTTVNGDTLTGSTTATALAYNTLTPGSAYVLGQRLNVTTNARNGFTVTVQENQPLTSSAGAIIGLFKDGATTTVPTVWTAPTNLINSPKTWGHFGVTSADADLNSGEFVATTTTPYAGNIDVPRAIFSHTGPADGVTTNQGSTTVAYRIQVGTLQPAANDYTNTLTYVATPVF